ncbi:MAG: DMT family transporter [Rhodospirillales bacterium]
MSDTTNKPQALRPATTADYTKMFSLGAIWGSAFMLMAIGLTAFHPFAVSTIRVTIGALALAIIGMAMGEKWPSGWRIWCWLSLVGLFNTAMPFSLITWGQQEVAANRAAILMATTPFVTLMLSHFFSDDDRISTLKLFGLTLGISGVILVVGFDALSESGQSVIGQLSIMAAAVCYSVSNILTRKLSYLPPILGTASYMATTVVYMVPLMALYWWPDEFTSDWEPYAALLALGLGPTALAFALRFQLIRDAGATFMSQVGYLVPVFGVAWAWLVLDEVPETTAFIAIALILLGIRVTQWKRPPKPNTLPSNRA